MSESSLPREKRDARDPDRHHVRSQDHEEGGAGGFVELGGRRGAGRASVVPVRNASGGARAALITAARVTGRLQAAGWRPRIESLARLKHLERLKRAVSRECSRESASNHERVCRLVREIVQSGTQPTAARGPMTRAAPRAAFRWSSPDRAPGWWAARRPFRVRASRRTFSPAGDRPPGELSGRREAHDRERAPRAQPLSR